MAVADVWHEEKNEGKHLREEQESEVLERGFESRLFLKLFYWFSPFAISLNLFQTLFFRFALKNHSPTLQFEELANVLYSIQRKFICVRILYDPVLKSSWNA